MRYWLDTEFIENGVTIDLISIAIVAEDGREFYRLNYDCDHSKANDWVKENVLRLMPEKHRANLAASEMDELSLKYVSRQRIVNDVIKFCDPEKYGFPEFWADFASYDWVVFCQLFGTMMDLPKKYPMYCNDIRQEWRRLGEPELPEQVTGHHNALSDAHHCRKLWQFLKNSKIGPV